MTAFIWRASRSSTRATGMPDWMVAITVSTAPARSAKDADRGRHRLGDAVEAELDLGDDAEGALGADEEAGEVVAGRGLAGAGAGADDGAVGGDDGEAEDVVAHGAVAHGVGAGGAGRGHAADRGVGAGVDREEQAGVAEVGVERLAGDAGLDAGVEVGGVDLEDAVEPRQVDGDAALDGGDVALERGAGAVGDDRGAVGGAEADDGGDLLGRDREGDGVGGVAGVVGGVLAVVLADGGGGRETLAEEGAEGGDGRGGVGAAGTGGGEGGHRGTSSGGRAAGTAPVRLERATGFEPATLSLGS